MVGERKKSLKSNLFLNNFPPIQVYTNQSINLIKMTKNSRRDPARVQRGSSLVQQSAAAKVSNTEGFDSKSVRDGIFFNEMSVSEKTFKSSLNSVVTGILSIILIAGMVNSGCSKKSDEWSKNSENERGKVRTFSDDTLPAYAQTNLVSDTAGFNAARIDPTLVNGWGIAINPSGIFWINANGTDNSEVFDRNGVPRRPPVSVPTPSGIVFNTTTDFIIPATNTLSRFIFASEDGKIYAWSSGNSALTVVDRSSFNAVYKGLELANDGSGNFLFATDFHNGKIDVFDKSFNLVSAKPFMDTRIPSGFAPFNIRLIDSVLYVTYAKQLAPDNHDDQKGPGNGYVDIYKKDGSLLKRFASRGKLNSPWGIEKATLGFGQGKEAILIGNFGDGRINVFDQEEGEFERPLFSNGKPLVIDGLWAITFPDGRVPGDNPDKLYFSAGPFDESHGLFGYLLKK